MVGRTSKKNKEIRAAEKSFRKHGIKIEGYCSICGIPLSREFPDDFPEDYRFCCMCKFIAKDIAHGYPVDYFLSKDNRAVKILERITLVE